MPYRTILARVAALGLLAGPAFAQSVVDVSSLRSIDDVDVHNAAGEEFGEVEEVLIDQAGTPVAVVIELGGVLGIGDEDVVVPFSAMTWQNGVYVTTLTEADIEALPRYDD